MTNRFEQFNKLEAGKRYTLVGLGEFGFPYSVQLTLVSVEQKGYAQYREGVELKFKKKRGQRVLGTRFYGRKECIIYEGWVEVDTNMFKNGSKASYACFDERYLQEAEESVSQKPIVNLGTPDRTTTGEIYFIAGMGEEHDGYYKCSKKEFEYHMANRGFEKMGEVESRSVREELRGQPRLKGLCGPMYDGEKEGHAVIRYESAELNKLLST